MSTTPVKRKKKFRGMDFFEDQLDEVDKLAKQTKMTATAIVRMALDAQLGLPKKDKHEN